MTNTQSLLDTKVAEAFKVIGHPVRFSITKSLFNHPKMCMNVSQIQEDLNLEQSIVSQHLARLRTNKVVSSTRQGHKVYYKLENQTVIKIFKALHS